VNKKLDFLQMIVRMYNLQENIKHQGRRKITDIWIYWGIGRKKMK